MTTTFSNPIKENIRQILLEYYDFPTMIKERNEGNDFSMYLVGLPCMLLNEKRYLIVLSGRDQYPIHWKRPLQEISWVSLQVRALKEDIFSDDIPVQTYSIKRGARYQLPLIVSERSKQITHYDIPDFPVQVSLLHTKGNEYEYPNEGNLVSALETFQTIIQWKN